MPEIKVSEGEFQEQVIDLAHYTGWTVAHFRSVRVQRKDGTVYYQTPVQADGEGFPDLVLAHPEKKRVIYAELKSDIGKPSPAQLRWIALLIACGQEVYIWHPKDFDEVVRILN